MWWNILVSLLLIPLISEAQRYDCSRDEYDGCVRIADPLVKEAHLVFPDNLNDIDIVCRTWNRFVDCLKAYTDNCFTDQQRKQFNRAVESPIESVHQMCMQPSYQKEYLRHAPCIKSTIIEREHCGTHYNLLVEQVEQGDVISKSTLCCSHDRFKNCVQRETRRLCDRGAPDGPASKFSSQIIDKALKFLQDQCINYIPNSGDCLPPHEISNSYSDRSDSKSALSPASSEVYPWSTVQQEAAPKEIFPSRLPKVSTTNWLPSSVSTRAEGDTNVLSGSEIFPTQHLGSRTRPASYGRSNNWSSEPSSSSTTLPSFQEKSSTPRDFEKKWSTSATWDVYGDFRQDNNDVRAKNSPTDAPTTTTVNYETPVTPLWNPSALPTVETWYPAAGNQLNNEVDEPNQLGLKKPRNGGDISLGTSFVMVILSICCSLRT